MNPIIKEAQIKLNLVLSAVTHKQIKHNIFVNHLQSKFNC